MVMVFTYRIEVGRKKIRKMKGHTKKVARPAGGHVRYYNIRTQLSSCVNQVDTSELFGGVLLLGLERK